MLYKTGAEIPAPGSNNRLARAMENNNACTDTDDGFACTFTDQVISGTLVQCAEHEGVDVGRDTGSNLHIQNNGELRIITPVSVFAPGKLVVFGKPDPTTLVQEQTLASRGGYAILFPVLKRKPCVDRWNPVSRENWLQSSMPMSPATAGSPERMRMVPTVSCAPACPPRTSA